MKKYRVWCKDKNEWERHPVFLDTSGNIWHFQNGCAIPIKPENHNVCFFTGLLDINGKEIYEGDIILYKDSDETREVGTIEWNDYDRAWGFIRKNSNCLMGHNFIGYGVEIEILGNIYENSELLRKQ
jgi:hypothetical protein